MPTRPSGDRPLAPLVLASAAIALPVWLAATVRTLVPALAGQLAVYDLRIYVNAAARLIEDPQRPYATLAGGFVYPPPAIVLFVPLARVPFPVAFAIVSVLTCALAVAAWWLVVRTFEEAAARTATRAERWGTLGLTFAFAPVLQTVKLGQVNVLVLVAALAAVRLLQRGRSGLAGAVLALGGWLKLYPLLLVPLAVTRRGGLRCAGGVGAMLAGVPLALLPLVPLALYGEYARVHAPAVAALNNVGGPNQSLVGIVERSGQPLAAMATYRYVPARPAARLVAAAALVAVVGGSTALAWRRREGAHVAQLLGVLALVPLVTPLGWEHTYVFALPAALWVVLARGALTNAQWLVAGAAFLVMCVPKLPDPWLAATADRWWAPLWHVFYVRYAVADLALAGLLWRLARQHR